MDKHDLDLISALAAGSLPPAEAAALEARFASDPAAVLELAEQRRALAAIGRARRPQLAEGERTALRMAVASRLNLEPDTAPVPTRRRVPWGAIAVGASALVAIVALAPVVGLIGDGSGDDAMTAADGGVETTRLGDTSLEADPANADVPPQVGETVATDAPGGQQESATTMATYMGTDRAMLYPKVVEDLALLAADPEAVQLLEQPTDLTTTCVAEAEEYFGEGTPTWFEFSHGTADQDAVTYVVFHLAASDGTTGRLVAFDPANCALPIEVPES